MARIIDADEEIEELEYNLARIKLVQQHFPKFKLQFDTHNQEYLFSDKSVKYSFSDIEVQSYSSLVSYSLVTKLPLTLNGKTVDIIVRNIPNWQALATVNYDYSKKDINNNYIGRIVCYPSFTCKDKERKKKAQNVFRLAILNFIKANPSYPLDDKNLDPRIKKLLIFT